MEEKEAGRRFPYFRPAGVYARALCSVPSLPFCVPFFYVLFTIAWPSMRPLALSSTGNLSAKKNNPLVRADGIVVIHAAMIDTPERLRAYPLENRLTSRRGGVGKKLLLKFPREVEFGGIRLDD